MKKPATTEPTTEPSQASKDPHPQASSTLGRTQDPGSQHQLPAPAPSYQQSDNLNIIQETTNPTGGDEDACYH